VFDLSILGVVASDTCNAI